MVYYNITRKQLVNKKPVNKMGLDPLTQTAI